MQIRIPQNELEDIIKAYFESSGFALAVTDLEFVTTDDGFHCEVEVAPPGAKAAAPTPRRRRKKASKDSAPTEDKTPAADVKQEKEPAAKEAGEEKDDNPFAAHVPDPKPETNAEDTEPTGETDDDAGEEEPEVVIAPSGNKSLFG